MEPTIREERRRLFRNELYRLREEGYLSNGVVDDAIILGWLALVSMLAGMFTHIKSYFFVGAGVLLLNLFLQTRPYWGDMP